MGLPAMRRYSERTSGASVCAMRKAGLAAHRAVRWGRSTGLPMAAILRLIAPMSRPKLIATGSHQNRTNRGEFQTLRSEWLDSAPERRGRRPVAPCAGRAVQHVVEGERPRAG